MKKNTKILTLSFFALVLIFLVSTFLFIRPSTNAAEVCCYHECLLSEDDRCDGNRPQFCGQCDGDDFNDWCDLPACGAGELCSNGVCQAVTIPCTMNCSTGPGCRSSFPNAEVDSSGECCGSGQCFTCRDAYHWDAASIACVYDCIDADNDGYGIAGSINCLNAGIDCDDTNRFIYPGSDETCDNVDNNCNTVIDEGCDDDSDGYCDKTMRFFNYPVSACPNTGVVDGDFGDDCDDGNVNIHPGVSEVCDGLADENCNGEVDEDCGCASGITRECGSNTGECEAGIETCGSDGTWMECLGGVESTLEVCDFKDNDCDGSIDEDLGQSICGLGICKHTVDNCVGGEINECDPFEGVNTIEICDNGLDDDCDGSIDCSDADCSSFCTACVDECTSGTGGCQTASSAWYCGEALDGDSCLDRIVTACDSSCDDVLGLCEEVSEFSVEVIKPAVSSADLGYSIDIKSGDNVDFAALASGGVAPYTYSWSLKWFEFSEAIGPVDMSEVISTEAIFSKAMNYSAGYYYLSLTVEDSSGQSILVDYGLDTNSEDKDQYLSLVFRIFEPLQVELLLPVDASVFERYETIEIQSKVSNGSYPYSKSWFMNGVEIKALPSDYSSDNSFTYFLDELGANVLDYKIVDSFNDEASDQISITVVTPSYPKTVIMSPENDDIFFENEIIVFQAASGVGGVAPYSYKWSSDVDGVIGTNQNFSTDALSINDHSVTLEIKDSVNNTWETSAINISVIPEQFDWSHKELPSALPAGTDDWMSPVRNQGSCGSCWAFATVATAEGQYNINQNDSTADINLSEQYFLKGCYLTRGCDGGFTSQAFNMLRDYGTPTESCYPYKTSDNTTCDTVCSDSSPMNEMWKVSQRMTMSQFIYDDEVHYRNLLKKIIMENGPLQSNFYISTWNSSTYGCSAPFSGSHAVVIVGWDETAGVWIVKNSWGSSWNGNGYFKVKYGDCSIDDQVSYIETVFKD